MSLVGKFTRDLSSRRAQHLVYLLHVWLCVPFLFFWVTDHRMAIVLGPHKVFELRLLAATMIGYMVIRTWLAYVDPPVLKWWLVFPPIDIALVTFMLCATHVGPMSNITLLYFLPMVQASSIMNARWSAVVGLMVVAGTALSVTFADLAPMLYYAPTTFQRMLHEDMLNVAFRVYFLMVFSSLLAYNGLIAASYRERLGVAADRNRIALEMHDGVQGHLIGIASRLELISRLSEADSKRAAELAIEGRESARQAADELRYLVQRLRTPTKAAGFVGALRQYAHNVCDRNALQVSFEFDGPELQVRPEVENALFRIAQEALTNVIKHAGAKAVSITLTLEGKAVRLAVVDDGVGFDTRTIINGVGLDGMATRAAENGGIFSIESHVGKGSKVEVAFALGGKHV